MHRLLFFRDKCGFILRHLSTVSKALDQQQLHPFLNKILGCTEDDVLHMLDKCPNIGKADPKELKDAMKALEKSNVKFSDIQRLPWVLAEKPTDLRTKLELVSQESPQVDANALILLKFPQKTLQRLLKKNANSNPSLVDRIKYLCQFLKLEPEELDKQLERHQCLLSMEFSKIQGIAKMLEDAQLPTENIVRDLWIFQHNQEVMESRLATLMAENMPVRIWLLRCAQKTFDTHIKKWKAIDAAVGPCYDRIQYLTRRLNCSSHVLLVIRNSPLMRVKELKLKEMLDFLFECGYTSADVLCFPRIFGSKLDTIKERYFEIMKISQCQPRLSFLGVTRKTYEFRIKQMEMERK